MISTWPQLVLNELHICVIIPLGFHAMTIKDQHNYGAPKGLTSVMFVFVCGMNCLAKLSARVGVRTMRMPIQKKALLLFSRD